MIPKFNKVHNRFRLNGHHYSFNELKEVAYSLIKEGTPNEKSSGEFLIDWTDKYDTINVKTSGSTGTPKTIRLSKQVMVNSAIATGDFFNLQPGDPALHCLPNDFIAGKMMLVRAMVLGLDLSVVAPSSMPVFDYLKTYMFSAMVPLQLKNCLPYIDTIKNIIVGGAPVSNGMKEQLQAVKSNIFETYGMTETCTHVALRRLNKVTTSQSFLALPNVTFKTDDRDCLIISAPHLDIDALVTNDVVTLTDEHTFEWLGRADFVINSGGVKVFPEQVENKLQTIIKQPFFISSFPDETFGDKVVLIVEGEENQLSSDVFTQLSKFEKPKEIIFIPRFERSSSGKPLRKKTIALL